MRIATQTEAASKGSPDTALTPVKAVSGLTGVLAKATQKSLPAVLIAGLLGALAGCQPGDGNASGADSAAGSDASGAAEMSDATSNSSSTADDSGATSLSDSKFESDEEIASYAIGYGVTTQATQQFSDVLDHPAFLAGAKAQLEGRESEIAPADAQRAITVMSEAQRAKMAVASSDNAKAGAEFLADNATKEGVVTTASGLQYLVLTEGSGPKPAITDTVTTHYEGKLINGEIFDSSIARGAPASFPLQGVIPGWTEALQLMSVGSKYRLFIPPEHAYREQGQGPIPPQSTLIFEVELLEIADAAAQ